MKILFVKLFKSYTETYISREMKAAGHEVTEITYYTPEDVYNDEALRGKVYADIKSHDPGIIFSVNYWPVVARACKDASRRYVSWSYDSPQNLPKTDTMEYDTNTIYLFDREEVSIYNKKGINTVHHLPLATVAESLPQKSYTHDITFLGQFYDSMLPSLTEIMSPYDRGMMEAYVSAQQKIYGAYILDELINEELTDRINAHYRSLSEKAIQITPAKLSYACATYITRLDRLTLKEALNVYCPTGIDYEKDMRPLFHSSKINLNPILRIIRSGIPLRALDIMGSNALLLSTWQPELAEHFTDGEDCVMYESLEDAVLKARFYLENDSERERIANNGYERVKRDFSYRDRIETILGGPSPLCA